MLKEESVILVIVIVYVQEMQSAASTLGNASSRLKIADAPTMMNV